MKRGIVFWAFAVMALGLFLNHRALPYPPGVGIMGKAKNCLVCHVNNGPWQDEENTIIDILDKDTKTSLKQADGSFLIQAKRGEIKTVLTVIGRKKGDKAASPNRHAWIYVDPKKIEGNSLSKFATGWTVNLFMACRIVGDTLEGFEGAKLTALPMSLRPGDDAQDAGLSLQAMVTKGESVKGDAKKGMIGNYFERLVRLKVLE